MKQLYAALLFGLCAALAVQAQPRQGGGGGFPGFGGGQQQQNRAGTTTGSQSYNPAGSVGNATFALDQDSHTLTVIADEATMLAISQVISNLDRPQPQVLIKVVFLEVQHNHSSDIGLEGSYNRQVDGFSRVTGFMTNFGVVDNQVVPTGITPINNSIIGQNNFGLANAAGPAGLYQILGSDFQATLRAIATAGRAQLLSRPSVLARDSQPATIVIGQSVPLITSVRYDTLGNAINSVTYTDVGIILRVTPYITPDGMVQMIVAPETSALNPNQTVPIAVGVNVPVIDVRSADTVVLTPDGQTVVIGGLMRSDNASANSKIPILGDIPLLGNLFKRQTKSDLKNELLIFLTPYIVRTSMEIASMSEAERLRALTPKSYSERDLERFLDKIPKVKE